MKFKLGWKNHFLKWVPGHHGTCRYPALSRAMASMGIIWSPWFRFFFSKWLSLLLILNMISLILHFFFFFQRGLDNISQHINMTVISQVTTKMLRKGYQSKHLSHSVYDILHEKKCINFIQSQPIKNNSGLLQGLQLSVTYFQLISCLIILPLRWLVRSHNVMLNNANFPMLNYPWWWHHCHGP